MNGITKVTKASLQHLRLVKSFRTKISTSWILTLAETVQLWFMKVNKTRTCFIFLPYIQMLSLYLDTYPEEIIFRQYQSRSLLLSWRGMLNMNDFIYSLSWSDFFSTENQTGTEKDSGFQTLPVFPHQAFTAALIWAPVLRRVYQ